MTDTTSPKGGRPVSEMQTFQTYTEGGGIIYFMMPREMTENDLSDLEAYFAIILRMKRRMVKDAEISIAEGGKDGD
ncbi:hypothetical protein V5F49_20245 [Xanthobacter sp. V3C-3]|uniref:hypothetical protein n=1 Tax=Xanthobacter lutulentifluminis TaxID=3119935 RepID=UPI00372AFA7F